LRDRWTRERRCCGRYCTGLEEGSAFHTGTCPTRDGQKSDASDCSGGLAPAGAQRKTRQQPFLISHTSLMRGLAGRGQGACAARTDELVKKWTAGGPSAFPPENDVEHALRRRLPFEAEEVAIGLESSFELPMKLGSVHLDGPELPEVIGHELCVEHDEAAENQAGGQIDEGDFRRIAHL